MEHLYGPRALANGYDRKASSPARFGHKPRAWLHVSCSRLNAIALLGGRPIESIRLSRVLRGIIESAAKLSSTSVVAYLKHNQAADRNEPQAGDVGGDLAIESLGIRAIGMCA